MPPLLSAGRARATYEFIRANRYQFSVEAMCHVQTYPTTSSPSTIQFAVTATSAA